MNGSSNSSNGSGDKSYGDDNGKGNSSSSRTVLLECNRCHHSSSHHSQQQQQQRQQWEGVVVELRAQLGVARTQLNQKEVVTRSLQRQLDQVIKSINRYCKW